MRDIQAVLDGLGPDDCRRRFWEQRKYEIKNRLYICVLHQLLQHQDDVDFKEQVEVMAVEIVKQMQARQPAPIPS